MQWNWQQPDWPRFRFDTQALAPLERTFLRQGGILIGAAQHLANDQSAQLKVEIISNEAIKTTKIEGETLDRDSVQSSIRRQFGLSKDHLRIGAAERDIATMMVDLYRRFDVPLTHQILFDWHTLLMSARRDIGEEGAYRTHAEPMQIVSGSIHAPKVHFEAPPSTRIAIEMDAFCSWFNDSAPNGALPLPALARSGIAHLYFESIHPFEDGNGRIGRAIAEKALAQGLGQPSLTAISVIIERRRKDYYAELEHATKSNEISRWLFWFSQTVLEAQSHTRHWIDFLIAKTRLLDSLRGRINARQEKALLRMLREGPDGFQGGLSAANYNSITGASPATARRDLGQLVAIGALTRTGQRKSTRYWLSLGQSEI